MEKVSVIVPVFNTEEKLLNECILSIITQNYKNIEIVIIDDGSNEKTANQCENYKKRVKADSIIVFHQRNKGLSEARNAGIESSTGDWIYFLDSDDSFENSEAISHLIKIANEEKCDLVIGEYHYRDGTRIETTPATGPEWLRKSLKSRNPSFAATDILISKKLINSLDYCFVPQMVHEDEEFTPRLLMRAKRVTAVPDIRTYKRNVRENSITSSKTEKGVFARCSSKMKLAEMILSSPYYQNAKDINKLMKIRAFEFINMAFKARALEISDDTFCEKLDDLSKKINYKSCPFGIRKRVLITWLCMNIVNLIGTDNYICILQRIFLKKRCLSK